MQWEVSDLQIATTWPGKFGCGALRGKFGSVPATYQALSMWKLTLSLEYSTLPLNGLYIKMCLIALMKCGGPLI